MGVLGKIKNFFVEEVEEDEDDEEEEVVEQEQLARKVEVPKKSFRERFKLREKLEEQEDEEEEETKDKIELEEQEPNVYIPKNSNVTFEEEEFTPPVKEEVTFEEEEEVELPSRSSRTPLVFQDDNLFQEEEDYAPEPAPEVVEDEEIEEEEEETPPPREKFKPPLLYQGRKESNYIDSIKKESYSTPRRKEESDGKFKPSPIISPIYGVLDKNYKKEEIRTKVDTSFNTNKKEKAIDNIRKKAYGSEKTEETKETEVKEKSEKKVNINHETPAVSKVTIADADEYYNDLGLAYNVDYKDISRSQTTKKKEEPKDKDDDNLFDLIDSMYNKKED